MIIFVDLAYSEHEETGMLAVFTYANELGFEPGLNSPEIALLKTTPDFYGILFFAILKPVFMHEIRRRMLACFEKLANVIQSSPMADFSFDFTEGSFLL